MNTFPGTRPAGSVRDGAAAKRRADRGRPPPAARGASDIFWYECSRSRAGPRCDPSRKEYMSNFMMRYFRVIAIFILYVLSSLDLRDLFG